MATVPVLIVGAGPTGLTLALWLTRLGVAVRIVDETAEPGTTSRALGLQARTLEFLRQVGLARRVIDDGVVASAVQVMTWGAPLTRVPLHDIGKGMSPFPFVLVYPQDAQERLLVDELLALGVAVERRTTLIGFEQAADAVHAVLRRPDGVEERCEAAYLAGCDGARSTVRQTLAIGFPGGTYSHLFYVADVEATGPVVDGDVCIDVDDGDFVAVFPLKGGGRVRLVGMVRDAAADAAQLRFADVQQRPLRRLGLTVGTVHWFSTYRVHHRVAHRFRDGRAFLLGDAAHIHSPAGAQGMNTGIGDAVNLAWKLAAVVQQCAPATLLDTYEAERIGFARRLVATTDRVFMLATAPRGLTARLRTWFVSAVVPIVFRLPAVRRFLFRTVSQVGIRYRRSPLSAGAAGRVHGGDRLPWVPLGDGDGADNYAPLVSLAWQVHVYGEPRSGMAAACAELGLPLHAFPWTAAVRRAGFVRGATYLVRPDGYLALVDRRGDPQRLRRHLRP